MNTVSLHTRFWLIQGLMLCAALAFCAALAWGGTALTLLSGSVACLLMGGNIWALEMAAASVGGFAPRPPALWLSYLLLLLGGLMAVALYVWGMAVAVAWSMNVLRGLFP